MIPPRRDAPPAQLPQSASSPAEKKGSVTFGYICKQGVVYGCKGLGIVSKYTGTFLESIGDYLSHIGENPIEEKEVKVVTTGDTITKIKRVGEKVTGKDIKVESEGDEESTKGEQGSVLQPVLPLSSLVVGGPPKGMSPPPPNFSLTMPRDNLDKVFEGYTKETSLARAGELRGMIKKTRTEKGNLDALCKVHKKKVDDNANKIETAKQTIDKLNKEHEQEREHIEMYMKVIDNKKLSEEQMITSEMIEEVSEGKYTTKIPVKVSDILYSIKLCKDEEGNKNKILSEQKLIEECEIEHKELQFVKDSDGNLLRDVDQAPMDIDKVTARINEMEKKINDYQKEIKMLNSFMKSKGWKEPTKFTKGEPIVEPKDVFEKAATTALIGKRELIRGLVKPLSKSPQSTDQ